MVAERPTAFRLLAAENPRTAITLRQRLEKTRKELLEHLLAPLAPDGYNRKAGTILGIDEAIQACIEVETELSERNK